METRISIKVFIGFYLIMLHIIYHADLQVKDFIWLDLPRNHLSWWSWPAGYIACCPRLSISSFYSILLNTARHSPSTYDRYYVCGKEHHAFNSSHLRVPICNFQQQKLRATSPYRVVFSWHDTIPKPSQV